MKAIIKSVSLSKEEADFIEAYDLSPSELIQSRVRELIMISDKTRLELEDVTRKLKKYVNGWQAVLDYLPDDEQKKQTIRVFADGMLKTDDENHL